MRDILNKFKVQKSKLLNPLCHSHESGNPGTDFKFRVKHGMTIKGVTMEKYKFNTIDEAIDDIAKGRMVILVDDEDRENEGDLCMAAEKVTPEAINFMAKYGRGLICLSLTPERVGELKLQMMTDDNTSPFGTAFTVSIEAKRGVTTGISASDRATTILTAINPNTKPEDISKPGHVFPLRAKRGGVLREPDRQRVLLTL